MLNISIECRWLEEASQIPAPLPNANESSVTQMFLLLDLKISIHLWARQLLLSFAGAITGKN